MVDMIEPKAKEEVPAFVERVMKQAHGLGASDLYWLPDADGVTIRYRAEGVQQTLGRATGEFAKQCLTHLKVLAGLLTYRTRIAQDGVIRRQVAGSEAEIRLASMPTAFGERMTLRLATQLTTPRHLEDLGLPEETIASLRRMLERPYGLIVLTGPTGCGKTTTIYAMIRELLRQNEDPASIISIEDPIESIIDGISQSSVSRDHEEWTYEKALKAALRQDVKTLLVGEIRDAAIAKVVLDAGLTGHRVITTYHAGDIPSVYARLLHQGFEPFLVASAITGVVTQRLVHTKGQAVPVMACLEADDQWREYIAGSPALNAIRQAIKRYPQACLDEAGQAAFKADIIDEQAWMRLHYE